MDKKPANGTVVSQGLKTVPPRLSMDEYADFVEVSLREANPARVARQKELEERIRTPFRIVDGKVLEAKPSTRSIRQALEE